MNTASISAPACRPRGSEQVRFLICPISRDLAAYYLILCDGSFMPQGRLSPSSDFVRCQLRQGVRLLVTSFALVRSKPQKYWRTACPPIQQSALISHPPARISCSPPPAPSVPSSLPTQYRRPVPPGIFSIPDIPFASPSPAASSPPQDVPAGCSFPALPDKAPCSP